MCSVRRPRKAIQKLQDLRMGFQQRDDELYKTMGVNPFGGCLLLINAYLNWFHFDFL